MDENKLHQYARSETAHPKENGNVCQPFESPFRSWLNAVGSFKREPWWVTRDDTEQLVAFAKQIQEEVNGSERTDCSVEAVVARVRPNLLIKNSQSGKEFKRWPFSLRLPIARR